MNKNRLKRMISAVLCAVMVSGSAVFSTTAKENTEDTGLRYDPFDKSPVYSGYTPDYSGYNSYSYEMFMDILKLYSETHLYEFSEQEATEAFLMKLMKENPDLMKMFLNTLLGTMDEYSGYYESGRGLAGDGSSKGYGIYYSDENSSEIRGMGITKPGIYITGVIKDSNAEKAGLRTGDRIASVEGITTEGLTIDAVGYLVKYQPYVAKEEFDEAGNSLGIPNEPEFVLDEVSGKKDYPLHIEVERNGEIIPVTLQKGRVVSSNISYSKTKDNSYSYIKIASFNGQSDVEDFGKAIERANKESNGNLIIDLRDNPGGALEHAVSMANMMIEDEGRILYYINSRNHAEPEAVYSAGGGYNFEKVTVLINGNSASAAELFAMIMKYNCGATLVGTTSYGKGVGQQGYSFVNGDMFTITSFEVLDPLKSSYNKSGIVPDIKIDLTLEKSHFPGELEYFGAENYTGLCEGSTGDAVLGLEKRLELIGFIKSEYVDGVYDSATTSAIKAFKLYYLEAPDELLCENDVDILTSLTEKYKNRYYYYDSQLDVAEMTFKSQSQAKRRVKELERRDKIVQAEYDAFLKAQEEKYKAEDKAEELENAMENAENTSSSSDEVNLGE
ncbi:MAG: PDZ domain-containing protein [Clostridia bacterium]|nr:PDZ domain-containing protein [Clostridia bacterium]